MGQRIWAVLEEYAGLWVTVNKAGAVIDSAETLPELTQRAGDNLHRLTFVFAAGQRAAVATRERESAAIAG